MNAAEGWIFIGGPADGWPSQEPDGLMLTIPIHRDGRWALLEDDPRDVTFHTYESHHRGYMYVGRVERRKTA